MHFGCIAVGAMPIKDRSQTRAPDVLIVGTDADWPFLIFRVLWSVSHEETRSEIDVCSIAGRRVEYGFKRQKS